MPLVSIIVPVYNTERYLRRCLDSIRNQTFSDFEVILVNDGSIDNSDVICKEFSAKDNRFKYYYKSNDGLATTRNFALSKLSGEYVYNVDSDDYIEPQTLELLVNATNNGLADIVFCSYFEEYSDKTITKILPFSNIKESPDFYLRKVLLGEFPGYNWTKLIKRSITQGIPYVDGADMWEDVAFSLKILTRVKHISFVKNPLYHYVMYNNNSILRSRGDKEEKAKRHFAQLQLNLKSVIEFFINNNIYHKFENEFQFFKFMSKSSLLSSPKRKDWELWYNTDSETNMLWKNHSTYSFKAKIIYFLVSNRMFWLYSILYRFRK